MPCTLQACCTAAGRNAPASCAGCAGQTHGLELVAGILLVLSGRKEWIVQTGSYPESHGLLTSEQSSIASSMVTENDVVLCSKRTYREGRGHKSWSQNGHRDQNQRPSAHPLPLPRCRKWESRRGSRHKKPRHYAGLSDIIQWLDSPIESGGYGWTRTTSAL